MRGGHGEVGVFILLDEQMKMKMKMAFTIYYYVCIFVALSPSFQLPYLTSPLGFALKSNYNNIAYVGY